VVTAAVGMVVDMAGAGTAGVAMAVDITAGYFLALADTIHVRITTIPLITLFRSSEAHRSDQP